MTKEDKDNLHYIRGRLDSLYDLTEKHNKEHGQRLRKAENKIFAIWVIGPILAGFLGLKQYFV